MAWFMTREHTDTKERLVRKWARHPQLRFLDRYKPAVARSASFGTLGRSLSTCEMATSNRQRNPYSSGRKVDHTGAYHGRLL